MNPPAGLVIGTEDAFALDFWVWVYPDQYLQLDDVVTVPITLPDGQTLQIHGVVDKVRSRYEGARFDSDAEKAAQQLLPVDIANSAHVTVTRVEPEIYIAPFPGKPVYRSTGPTRLEALYFDGMVAANTAFTAGLSRDGQPVYGNMEFLDGTRGAHMNISGVSGVATKTTYALFLLYSLFNSSVMKGGSPNTRAIIFNVKGEDLLWLDKPNRRLTDRDRERYAALGLPVGPFPSVAFWSPASRTSADLLMPSTETRTEGVTAFAWSLHEFCSKRMLRFLFAEADNETSQLSFAIRQVEDYLADPNHVSGPDARGWIHVDGNPIDTFLTLCLHIEANIDQMASRLVGGTLNAFIRRLMEAASAAGHMVRAMTAEQVDAHTLRYDGTGKHGNKQVTVVDIHNLTDRAKRFVVGAMVRRLVEEKENTGGEARTYLVLDELNKYAPREGWSPIKEVILDIAERGRSLGVILIGAQQTASEIERRVTANAAFRVAGRLDTAEASRQEYGFLTDAARVRASILKPGTMFVHQPEIPVPLLVQFPFPAWATRKDEVDADAAPGRELRGGRV